MVDKEIGILWHEHNPGKVAPTEVCACSRCNLIQKWVVERAHHRSMHYSPTQDWTKFVEAALDDAGIEHTKLEAYHGT